MELRDAVCLVTGASSGIGRETAGALARRGARLVVTGRRHETLSAVARDTSGYAIPADLSRPGEADRLASEAEAVHGRIDVLVNNAGAGWTGRFEDMPATLAESLVTLNLLAPMRLTRALLPGMLALGRGHVVNVASIAGHVGVREEAVYAATKAALVTFSDSLRYEVDETVRVTVVNPGAVDTRFFERQGRPYARRRPKPIPAERVAGAIVRAIEKERAEVFVPRWMAFPARLRGALPGLYRALARRFG